MRPCKTMCLVGALLMLAACSTRRLAQRDASPSEPLADFKGNFAGNQISNDGARVKIDFDVQRKGDEFSGTYSCAAGNANCRNRIVRGWVQGSIDASTFRVSLQDSSWCLYTLGAFYLNDGEGQYTCYIGGAIVEQGTFAIKRVEPE